MKNEDIPIVILAGGRGTRLMEETRVIPKPMVTIGGKPMLFHIMLYYSSFGFRNFVVCLGYLGHIVKEYFIDINKHISSMKIYSKDGRVEYTSTLIQDWEITLAETGENSLTATRLVNVRDYIDAPVFGLTYGDGLSDVDLDAELAFHRSHGKVGTMAAVHPPSRFGMMEIGPDGQVLSFREKEVLQHDYINGGFFFFDSSFLDRLSTTENQSLESDPLVHLATDGELFTWRHEGFWKCMDTMRDREDLEEIYESGNAPWVGER